MNHRIRIAVLLLGVLFVVPEGHLGQATPPRAQLQSAASSPAPAAGQPASVTVPEADQAVVAGAQASLNSRGWSARSAVVASSGDEYLDPVVLAAYNLAVAAAPPSCRLPVSLLAAIGQVESGNLAGRALDARHRVVPAMLGPVLDGSPFLAVPDTDAGQWDGNRRWDRALGPLQLIPATWRAVKVDMDADGVRDPQDIDDAAGAAMVYLCAGGRDLSTAAGVEEAVLSYNHSADYLRAVLSWKAVFDRAALSFVDSAQLFATQVLPPVLPASTPTFTPVVGAGHSPATPQVRPTATARPQTPAAAPGSLTPSTPSASATPSTSAPAPKPTPKPIPSEEPTQSATPAPTPDPTLPPCPLPTGTPSGPADPSGSPTPSPSPTTGADGTPVTPVPVAPTVDADGNPCLAPVDPETGEPVTDGSVSGGSVSGGSVSGGSGTASSQTRSADPDTP